MEALQVTPEWIKTAREGNKNYRLYVNGDNYI